MPQLVRDLDLGVARKGGRRIVVGLGLVRFKLGHSGVRGKVRSARVYCMPSRIFRAQIEIPLQNRLRRMASQNVTADRKRNL